MANIEHAFTYNMNIGPVTIADNGDAIIAVSFGDKSPARYTKAAETPLIKEAARQIEEYLRKERRLFELPLAPGGTPFQQRVWAALRNIPYGHTKSYKDIAEAIGQSKAFRAVGMACHKNRIVIIIPCHRVVGADGRLTGYTGGLELKARLLELER